MNPEHQVRDDLRGTTLPPSLNPPSDLADVLLHRLHRQRRHRTLQAIAAAAAAVAVAVGVPVLTGRGTPSGPAATQPAATPTASPTIAPPSEAPEAFGPMVQYADFGWLPDGLVERYVATGRNWLHVEAAFPTLPSDEDRRSISLSVVTAGHGINSLQPAEFATAPNEVGGGSAASNAAEPINGRPALWNLGSPSQVALRWEYAPGAWAEVSISGVTNEIGDLKQAARRIATTVRFAVDEPIRLPFQATGLPNNLRPTSATVSRNLADADQWSAQVAYGSSSQRPATGDWPLTILATANTATTGDDSIVGDPTTTVDGHPARQSTLADGGQALQVFNVDGVYLELLGHGAATIAQLPKGLRGVFRGLRLFPNPNGWR